MRDFIFHILILSLLIFRKNCYRYRQTENRAKVAPYYDNSVGSWIRRIEKIWIPAVPQTHGGFVNLTALSTNFLMTENEKQTYKKPKKPNHRCSISRTQSYIWAGHIKQALNKHQSWWVWWNDLVFLLQYSKDHLKSKTTQVKGKQRVLLLLMVE